jgi:hypothetical protein
LVLEELSPPPHDDINSSVTNAKTKAAERDVRLQNRFMKYERCC